MINTYFVHSYYVDTDPEYIVSTANYGIDVPGIVERGRVYGMHSILKKRCRRSKFVVYIWGLLQNL